MFTDRRDLSPVPAAADLRLLNGFSTPVWIYEYGSASIFWANLAAIELWEASSLDELKDRDLKSGMSETVRRRLIQYSIDLSSIEWLDEPWTIYPKGTPKALNCRFSKYDISASRSAMMVEAIEQNPRASKWAYIEQTILHTSAMISSYDLDGNLLYANPAARAAIPKDSQNFRQRIFNSKMISRLGNNIERSFSGQSSVRTSRGDRFHDIHISGGYDPKDGKPIFVFTETDVTSLAEAKLSLEWAATHDYLTGILNRAGFEEATKKLIETARSVDAEYNLFVLDIDNFKDVNDSFGHHCGDLLLVEVAKILTDILPKDAIIARLGGDEFAVFTCNNNSSHTATILSSVQAALSASKRIGSATLIAHASVGVSVFPRNGKSFDLLLKRADEALYVAKETGGNTLSYYQPCISKKRRRTQLISDDLRRSLTNGDQTIAVQPRISIASMQIVGGEILLRVPGKLGKPTLTPEVIESLERTGLILEYGRFVAHETVKLQRRLKTLGHSVTLSFNYSAKQLQDKSFLDDLYSFTLDLGVEPAFIEIEITETTCIEKHPTALKFIRDAKSYGFRIAIDDFGVGYSNLMRLQRLQADSIKIDRSIVSLGRRSPILQSAVLLAQSMSKTLVAEGVTDPSLLPWLKETGCSQFQGKLFSMPVCVDLFVALL